MYAYVPLLIYFSLINNFSSFSYFYVYFYSSVHLPISPHLFLCMSIYIIQSISSSIYLSSFMCFSPWPSIFICPCLSPIVYQFFHFHIGIFVYSLAYAIQQLPIKPIYITHLLKPFCFHFPFYYFCNSSPPFPIQSSFSSHLVQQTHLFITPFLLLFL